MCKTQPILVVRSEKLDDDKIATYFSPKRVGLKIVHYVHSHQSKSFVWRHSTSVVSAKQPQLCRFLGLQMQTSFESLTGQANLQFKGWNWNDWPHCDFNHHQLFISFSRLLPIFERIVRLYYKSQVLVFFFIIISKRSMQNCHCEPATITKNRLLLLLMMMTWLWKRGEIDNDLFICKATHVNAWLVPQTRLELWLSM